MSSHVFESLATCFAGCKQFLVDRPRIALYSFLLISCLLFLTIRAFTQYKKRPLRRLNSPDPEKRTPSRGSTFKAPQREPGVWDPVDFKRPAAPPLPDWDVNKTEPRPYRPFRHGPYHITMGLRTMQWDEWIELDRHYLRYHGDKKRRIKERGQKCCRTAPEAFDGAIELLEEL